MLKSRSLVSGAAAVAALAPLVTSVAMLAPASASAAVSRLAPVISSLSPNAGAVEGHNTVIITGTGFSKRDKVRFGKKWALRVTFLSRTELAAVSPPRRHAKVVHIWVFSHGRPSNPLEFTYSTVQIDELCVPGGGVAPSLILWVSPRHRAWMYDKTTHVKTSAVITDMNPQNKWWHYGTETGLTNHRRYSITVYLDGRRHVVPRFRMGAKCGFTIWRGQDYKHRRR